MTPRPPSPRACAGSPLAARGARHKKLAADDDATEAGVTHGDDGDGDGDVAGAPAGAADANDLPSPQKLVLEFASEERALHLHSLLHTKRRLWSIASGKERQGGRRASRPSRESHSSHEHEELVM